MSGGVSNLARARGRDRGRRTAVRIVARARPSSLGFDERLHDLARARRGERLRRWRGSELVIQGISRHRVGHLRANARARTRPRARGRRSTASRPCWAARARRTPTTQARACPRRETRMRPSRTRPRPRGGVWKSPRRGPRPDPLAMATLGTPPNVDSRYAEGDEEKRLIVACVPGLGPTFAKTLKVETVRHANFVTCHAEFLLVACCSTVASHSRAFCCARRLANRRVLRSGRGTSSARATTTITWRPPSRSPSSLSRASSSSRSGTRASRPEPASLFTRPPSSLGPANSAKCPSSVITRAARETPGAPPAARRPRRRGTPSAPRTATMSPSRSPSRWTE